MRTGRRWWRVLAVLSPEDDFDAVIERLRAGEVDLVLVDAALPGAASMLRTGVWSMIVCRESVVFAPLLEGLPACCHVIGSQSRVGRFVDQATERARGDVAGVTPFPSWSEGLDPSEIPAFDEASDQDPFGQNPKLLDEAWTHVALFLCKLAIGAHSRGLAVAQAPDVSGFLTMSGEEWWRLTNVSQSAPEEWRSLSLPSSDYVPGPGPVLDVVQRCLVVLGALVAADDVDAWKDASVAMQHLGYLLISSHVDVAGIDAFQRYVDIGMFAAGSHQRNTLHGDLHPGNFARFENQLVTIDTETIRTPDRPLTAGDCAADLALLRFHCTFPQWEAVKFGYASVAPERAAEVFALL